MRGWNFPDIFKHNKVEILEAEEKVLNDLRLFLKTELYEFTQDAGYGSNVSRLLYKPKSKLVLDLLKDAISQVELYFPSISINKHKIVVEYSEAGKVEVEVEIKIGASLDPIKLQLEV